MMQPSKEIVFIYCRIFECHDQDFLSVAKFQSSKAKKSIPDGGICYALRDVVVGETCMLSNIYRMSRQQEGSWKKKKIQGG